VRAELLRVGFEHLQILEECVHLRVPALILRRTKKQTRRCAIHKQLQHGNATFFPVIECLLARGKSVPTVVNEHVTTNYLSVYGRTGSSSIALYKQQSPDCAVLADARGRTVRPPENRRTGSKGAGRALLFRMPVSLRDFTILPKK
jgi:hypothetical protein